MAGRRRRDDGDTVHGDTVHGDTVHGDTVHGAGTAGSADTRDDAGRGSGDDATIWGGYVTYTRETTLVLTGTTTARLARYERAEVITPPRVGGERRYRPEDLLRIRKARRLEDDLGINLPGIHAVLRLSDRLDELRRRLEAYERGGGHTAR
jgi:hypothetical protein